MVLSEVLQMMIKASLFNNVKVPIIHNEMKYSSSKFYTKFAKQCTKVLPSVQYNVPFIVFSLDILYTPRIHNVTFKIPGQLPEH